jgi:hypothetical protein
MGGAIPFGFKRAFQKNVPSPLVVVDREAILYRQEVMRDIEDAGIKAAMETFTSAMGAMREAPDGGTASGRIALALPSSKRRFGRDSDRQSNRAVVTAQRMAWRRKQNAVERERSAASSSAGDAEATSFWGEAEASVDPAVFRRRRGRFIEVLRSSMGRTPAVDRAGVIGRGGCYPVNSTTFDLTIIIPQDHNVK